MKIGITGSLASGKSTVTKLLAKEKFPTFNADLEVKNLYKNKSSISSWVDSSSYTFIEVLRGKVSFGSILDSLGFKSLPSLNDQSPAGMRYFSGGYNTARHGSRNNGVISAIQIELPKPGIRDNQSTWSNYSIAINSAISEYYLIHLNRNIKN